jgi:GntR family transcriptional regulator, transcriptional repressor for pyruvate dehydrogenase complex
MPQVRQPRVAEIVAAQVRDEILTGRLKEGDVLANQEQLFSEYQVSPPALREAMRILETDGLITVRRGNIGGAVVHAPTPQRAAQMIAMVLQTRATPPTEVSEALGYLEPICAGLCAGREDRDMEVVPVLTELMEKQAASIDDIEAYLRYSSEFHRSLVTLCGNEPMIVVIGALETIWSAHDALVWETIADVTDVEADPDSPLARKTRRAALRAHHKLVAEIANGDSPKATTLAAAHLRAAHTNTLRSAEDRTIMANLVNANNALDHTRSRRV